MIIPLFGGDNTFELEFHKFLEQNEDTFMRLHGFCVAKMAKINGKNRIISYRQDGYEVFLTDGFTEYPQLYKSVGGIKRFLSRHPDWISAYWISDMIHSKPLLKYVDLKNRFPGSPRR